MRSSIAEKWVGIWRDKPTPKSWTGIIGVTVRPSLPPTSDGQCSALSALVMCSSAAPIQLQLKSAVAHLKLAHQCSLDAVLAMVQEAYDETEEDREPEDDSDELEEEQSEEESLTLTSK